MDASQEAHRQSDSRGRDNPSAKASASYAEPASATPADVPPAGASPGKDPRPETAHAAQTIVTLDGRAVLGRIIRAQYRDVPFRIPEDGPSANRDVVMSTERHAWCPLFSQLEDCLTRHGVSFEGACGARPDERFKPWFLYLDFSGLRNEMSSQESFLETPYGKALTHLVETGFSLEDTQGRLWHYTVFDMSASNARNAIVSFLADRGYDFQGNELHLYPELNERLCLDIDFAELSAACPRSVVWNKYFTYRGLYLTTARPVPLSDAFALTKESVLVIDTADLSVPCNVRRARSRTTQEDGAVRADFCTESIAEGGSVSVRLFDGEGLIAPDYAAHIRSTVFQGSGQDAQPSSFQVRMPFTKGVLHEVDFHGFLAEALDLDAQSYAELMIPDAFGVPRRLSQVRIVLTTDMLKCHQWLVAWLGLSPKRQQAYTTQGMADPMDYYFARFHAYHHALWVLFKRRKSGKTHEVPSNYQHLSTLALNSRTFDRFAAKEFARLGNALFDAEQARAVLLASLDGEGGNQGRDSALAYALNKDVRFVYDPHIRKQVLNAVNSRLIDYATGKLPVKGTLRMLSQDLLAFLCLMANRVLSLRQSDILGTLASARLHLRDIESHCLAPQTLYLPRYEEPVNETGWLAVFRNPHLSRSEQCALRPLQPDADSWHARYFGHLEDVAMVACASPEPMVLGGADYDGDTVHVYDDAVVVEAVLGGAYENAPDAGCEQETEGDAGNGEHDQSQAWADALTPNATLPRRFPIADLTGVAEPSTPATPADGPAFQEGIEGPLPHERIDAHLTSNQLLRSFQNNIGVLCNSALRLGSILYGEVEGHANGDERSSLKPRQPQDDVCANYTIAVGLDIDAVKTGLRLDMHDLLIDGGRKRVARFDVAGCLLPPKLDSIAFTKTIAPRLKKSAPVWTYEKLDRNQPGWLQVHLKSGEPPTFATLDLGTDLSLSDSLRGASVSNIQRLPWLLVQEARRIHVMEDDPDFIDGCARNTPSPLEELYPLFAATVDRKKLKALKGLVSAHHSALYRLRARDQRTAFAKSSKAFGKARRRAQEYPTQFSEEDIDAILSQAVLDIKDHFAAQNDYGYADALAAFGERGFTDWALCPSGERAERLQEFLPGLVFSADFYLILEDDALPQGFMVPFYLLKAAQDVESAQEMLVADEGDKTPVDLPEAPESTDAGNARDEGDEQDASYIPKDPQMHAELVAIINRHLRAKSSRSLMAEDLLAALKARIADVLSEEDHLLEYLTVLKYEGLCFSERTYTSRALFWDLLSVNDLKEVLG